MYRFRHLHSKREAALRLGSYSIAATRAKITLISFQVQIGFSTISHHDDVLCATVSCVHLFCRRLQRNAEVQRRDLIKSRPVIPR
jgi:hypothetical protein